MASKSTSQRTFDVVEAVQGLDANNKTSKHMAHQKQYTNNVPEIVLQLEKNALTQLFITNGYHCVAVGSDGTEKISNSLLRNTSLKTFNIASNKIGDNGATSISNSLITNTSLAHLDLRFNLISDNGAISISNSLIKNTSLTHLNLHGNSIFNFKLCTFIVLDGVLCTSFGYKLHITIHCKVFEKSPASCPVFTEFFACGSFDFVLVCNTDHQSEPFILEYCYGVG